MQNQYHIYAIDLRGFGQSTYHRPIDSLRDFADDVKLWINELQLKEFSLMGWSMGGGVAMEFVASHKELVKNLILVESVGMKGYPIFKKDVNGQPIVSTLLKTKEEIAQDPVQIVPVLEAIKKDEQALLPNVMEYVNLYT